MKVEFVRIKEAEPYARLYANEESDDIKCLKKYIENDQYKTRKILCHDGNEMYHVNSEDICFIESINEILYLHTNEQTFTSRQRLYEMQEILPHDFLRASRSALLNIRQVKRYKPLPNGLMMAEFENKEICYISRKYLRELRDRIKEV